MTMLRFAIGLYVVGLLVVPCKAVYAKTLTAHEYNIVDLDSLVDALGEVEPIDEFPLLATLSWHYAFVHIDSASLFAYKAGALALNANDVDWEVQALFLQGRIARYMNDQATALGLLLKAVGKLEQEGVHNRTRLNVLRETANVYAQAGHWQKARAFYEKGMPLARILQDIDAQLLLLEATGDLALQLDDASAEGIFRKMLHLADSVDDAFSYHSAYGSLGIVRLNQGLATEALPYLRQMIEFTLSRGMYARTAKNNIFLGEALVELGRYEEADSTLGWSLEILAAGNDFKGMADVYALLSDMNTRQGRHQQALDYYKLGQQQEDNLENRASFWDINRVGVEHEEQLKAEEENKVAYKGRLRVLWMRIFLIIVILLIGLAITVVWATRTRTRLNALLDLTNEKVMRTNERLVETNATILQQAKDLNGQTQEILTHKEELAELNETKDRMLSVISQDFREPLDALHQVLDLLQHEHLEGDALDQVLVTISDSITSNLHLIETLLHWTAAQMKGTQMVRTEFDLLALGQDVWVPMERAAESKGIALEIEAMGTMWVTADRDMLSFVLRNVLSQCIKEAEEGDQVCLVIAAEGDQVGVTILVRTLTGLPMQSVTSAGLNQVDSTDLMAMENPSAGREQVAAVGLYLSQKFMEMHGSTLRVSMLSGFQEYSFTLNRAAKPVTVL